MRTKTRRWLRRLAPWVITGAVVAAILSKYSLARIASELRDADTLAILPYAVALPLCHLVVQAIWDRWVINGATGARLGYFDLVRGRGGSAVLLALGFAFSAGGYGLWVARKTGADVRTTLGTIAYIMMSGLIAIGVLATAAIWFGGAELDSEAAERLGVPPRVVGVIAPLMVGFFVLITMTGPRALRRLAGPRFLAPWQRIGPGLFLANVLGRCFDIGLIVLYSWLGARAFGLDIPLQVFFSFFPIVILIGSLPINIAGFGAVQAAWLVFEPWAAGERILAFQFVWHMATGLVIVLRGLPFVRGVMREVEEGVRSSTSAGTAGEPEPARAP